MEAQSDECAGKTLAVNGKAGSEEYKRKDQESLKKTLKMDWEGWQRRRRGCKLKVLEDQGDKGDEDGFFEVW